MTQGSQTRTFDYDSLRRLRQAINPESGTVTYGYDQNGNLTSRGDARASFTSTYDALDRLTKKTYTGVTTPEENRCYDGKLYVGTACSGSAVSGELGFLTWVGNSTSSTHYRHQELGLVKWSQQTTGGSSYAFQQASGTPNDGYLYSQGRLTDIYYPSGRHVSYGYDAAGRVNTVGGFVTGVQYDPSGPPSQITLGNGVVEAIGFNNRLQTKSIEATKSASLWKLENFYCASEGASCASNNGNVLSQKQTIGAVSWPTAYTYDGVNRLTAATETPNGATGWSHTFTYGNQYGNMTFVDSVGVVPSGLKCNSYNSANNRCNSAGFGYDGAGNLTSAAGRSMTYDAESRQATLIYGGTTQYLYDGEGRRVQKVSGGQTTTYVYDATGQLVAEYGGPAAYGPSCLTCHLTVDHLGSTRLVTDEQGAPVRRWDYTPFGWEINGSYGKRPQISGYVTSDGVQPKFTGKMRDYESGLNLDYFGARYLSSAQGRWTSPDWSAVPQPVPYADLTDPQTLNLYGYVRNNPLSGIDPDGHLDCTGKHAEGAGCQFLADWNAAHGIGEKAKVATVAALKTVGNGMDKASAFLNTTPGLSLVVGMAVFAETGGSAETPAVAAAETELELLLPKAFSQVERIGSALAKNDRFHRPVAFLSDELRQSGSRFWITGGDGVKRILVQLSATIDDIMGQVEIIYDPTIQKITHQQFIPGGTINGKPIKP
ncbi:RHS repeat domain-containing protein [Paludibaculum fermentans]|uniref:RHS repeat domain-containing protein n=1 Tax=Paludibaculum fermentans TaxID=1473598 RepID=UPI003EBC82AA